MVTQSISASTERNSAMLRQRLGPRVLSVGSGAGKLYIQEFYQLIYNINPRNTWFLFKHLQKREVQGLRICPWVRNTAVDLITFVPRLPI